MGAVSRCEISRTAPGGCGVRWRAGHDREQLQFCKTKQMERKVCLHFCTLPRYLVVLSQDRRQTQRLQVMFEQHLRGIGCVLMRHLPNKQALSHRSHPRSKLLAEVAGICIAHSPRGKSSICRVRSSRTEVDCENRDWGVPQPSLRMAMYRPPGLTATVPGKALPDAGLPGMGKERSCPDGNLVPSPACCAKERWKSEAQPQHARVR